MIHNAMGLLYLNPANSLKVAIARKKPRPNMTRQDIRKNYGPISLLGMIMKEYCTPIERLVFHPLRIGNRRIR